MEWLNLINPKVKNVLSFYDRIKYFSASTPIYFTITNTSANIQTATLFGANVRAALPNFGNDPSLIFTFGYNTPYTYRAILNNTVGTAAYGIGRIRFQGRDQITTAEITQSLVYTRYFPDGVKEIAPVVSFALLNQFILDASEINVDLVVDGDTEISLSVLPFDMVGVYLYPTFVTALVLLSETGFAGIKTKYPDIPMAGNFTANYKRFAVRLRDKI